MIDGMEKFIHNITVIGISTLLAAAPFVGGCSDRDSGPDAAALIEKLGSKEKDTQIKAAWSLSKMEAKAVEPLAKAMRGKDRTLAWRAADVLRMIGKPAVASLQTALADKDAPWPEAAARALAMIGPASDDVVNALLKILKTGDPEARALAADTLGRGNIKPETATEPLLNALRDDNVDVCKSAAWALAAIGDTSVEPMISALSDSRVTHKRCVAMVLSKFGPAATKATKPMTEMLESEDAEKRELAIYVLKRIKPDPEIAIVPLIAALDDPKHTVCEPAAGILGRMGTAAVGPLIEVLTDKNAKRPGLAAIGLAGIGHEAAKAVDPLLALLKSGDETARGQAAYAISRIAHSDAKVVSALIEAMKNDPGEYSVQMYAAEALGRLRPPATSAIAALTEATKHPNRSVSQAAVEAIEEIKSPSPLKKQDHSRCQHPDHDH